jgi:hypothetical protein
MGIDLRLDGLDRKVDLLRDSLDKQLDVLDVKIDLVRDVLDGKIDRSLVDGRCCSRNLANDDLCAHRVKLSSPLSSNSWRLSLT